MAASTSIDLGMPESDWHVRIDDRCTCVYCGLCGVDNFEVWMDLGIEHIIPRRFGGDESEENKAVACTECNCLKAKYVPQGNTREERIADARRIIQERRERWRPIFEMMMEEVHRH